MKILSDGSDLEGVERPEDLQYMKLLRASLAVIGGWPKGPKENSTYRYFLIIMNVSCLVPEILYLRNNVGKVSFFELGHSYITCCMNMIVSTRAIIICSKKYNDLGFHFMNVMHLFNQRNTSDYANKTHILVHKICHFCTVFIISSMALGIMLFNLTPVYNSYADGMFRTEKPANATFDHSVYFALPFDYTTQYKGYAIVATFNWFISYTCSTYLCIADLYISIMVFHLWGHMRVLIYNLNNFAKPASVMTEPSKNKVTVQNRYTEEDGKEVFSKMRDYIHHHSLIINFKSRMSHTFSEYLIGFYTYQQIIGCLLLLECSQLDTKAMTRYGLLTAITFQQLIQMSVIFELLGLSNDKLTDAVYCLPWEYMETRHRKLVFFMLKQSQRPMNLRAMSMITVGVQTMIAIMKTSFSYFIMLRTVAEE